MLVNRTGTFFMILGGFLLLLFILSVQGSAAGNSALFFWGIGCFFLGIFLWLRGPAQPRPPADRFRLLRRMSKKDKKTPDTRENDQRSPRSNSR
ncbi:MAG: hypothetical protein AB1453_00920 [Chloroflexota bacterium]|jgi:hypothetical protein